MPVITPSRRVARAVYDFAIDGGAVSTIALRGDRIPQGAIITDVLLDIAVAPVGGTVTDTLALGSEGAGDLQSAAARNAAPWSTVGAKRGTLTATSAPVKTTADRAVSFVIAATVLTAGRFAVLVAYVEMP